GRTGNDDVEIRNAVGKICQLHGAGIEATGEVFSALRRAVGHYHGPRMYRSEVSGTELDHLTRTDEERIALGKVAKHTFCQLNRSGSHRYGMRPNRRGAA